MRLIPVGQIVSAHGVKGEVKFWYYSDDGTMSLQYQNFLVCKAGEEIVLSSQHIRRQGASFIIKFKGFDSAESVGFLMKQELFVAEKDLPEPDDSEYYDFQLIGLEVVTETGRSVGTVKDVMHTGAHDILVIQGNGEIMIPMVEDHIQAIDIAGGRVQIQESELVE
jgi:16S rRNA processing protein RimM